MVRAPFAETNPRRPCVTSTLRKARVQNRRVPKTPEKRAQVKFDSRGPQIVQVKNWLGKENLWPDAEGDIEMKYTK